MAREGRIARPRRTTLVRTAKLACAGAFVALMFAAAPAHAASGIYQDLLASCTSQINSMPIHVRFPQHRVYARVHPRTADGISISTCADFDWVQFKGNYTAAQISWRGRAALSAWDCNHSVLVWGLYRKQSNGTWVWVNGGGSFGNMPGTQCLYDKTGFPQSSNWGTFNTFTNAPSGDFEYRMAFNAWSHDDPNFGHPSYCAHPTDCSWPVELMLGGAFPPPRQDFVYWRPINGMWSFKDSTSGSTFDQQWGGSGDIIGHGDYDGDYKTDFAVVRQTAQGRTWFVINSSTNQSFSQVWGLNSDTLTPGGDFDGDGRTDIAVFRPSTGTFHVINSRTWSGTSFQWGGSGDWPLAGHYFDDDLRSDYTVWTPSTGIWKIAYSGWGGSTQVQWGVSGDIPQKGDFDGDGRSDIAVWRPSNGTWYIVSSINGGSWWHQWGLNNDMPVPGYYDGDLKTDVAVYRFSESRWYYVHSSTGSGFWTAWGQSGAQPAAPFARP